MMRPSFHLSSGNRKQNTSRGTRRDLNCDKLPRAVLATTGAEANDKSTGYTDFFSYLAP